TGISWFLYLLVHRLFEMQGHGFHAIIVSYSVVAWIILLEGSFIKTRSPFEEYYRTLKMVIMLLWAGLLVSMPFVPLHYNSTAQTTMGESILLGNFFFIPAFIAGLIGLVLWRKKMRERLVLFARRKKFYPEKDDRLAGLLSLGIPLYLIALFFL
ncbi:MAG: hypothetical protein COB65_12900, partial [Thalassobium sp.]